MAGRLAAKVIGSVAKTAESKPAFVYRGRFSSSGKYLFVAHPNCCPKCNALGLSPHFFNTPDVAFITHPNCKCATVEAPAGLSPSQLMEWAKHPTGVMRYGFNYGVPLREQNLTERNRKTQTAAWYNRMMTGTGSRAKVRSEVTQRRINAVRKAVADGALGPAKNLTAGVKGLATKEAKRIAAAESQKRRATRKAGSAAAKAAAKWLGRKKRR